MSSPKQAVQQLLGKAGITINGSDPWDMRVNNDKLYNRILANGSIGLGEAYMDNWWDCVSLDSFFFRLLKAEIDRSVPFNWNTFFFGLKAKLFNQQTKYKSAEVAVKHYDIGNDLYQKMLDKRMVYSCGYWDNAETLDQAQENKLELICRKLKLESGMRLLDIGCGWGGLAQYAAENYGVSVVGITLSEQQLIIAKQVNQDFPVEIRLQDYRDLRGKFDRIVSVGMFEHVGYKNYGTFMKTACENLTTDGIFLLHCIGGDRSVTHTDAWMNKYIFPNSMLPSIEQIAQATEGQFVVEDWHNFGPFYDRTLMEWQRNFECSWHELRAKYGDVFYRMWRYYLSASAGSFRSKRNQLWQIVLTKPERLRGYQSIRFNNGLSEVKAELA